jgi:hypothetical protein
MINSKILEEEYEQFKDFFAIPRDAIFRWKDGPGDGFFTAICENSGVTDASFSLAGVENLYTAHKILLFFEMTVDNGKTWTPAGTKVIYQ